MSAPRACEVASALPSPGPVGEVQASVLARRLTSCSISARASTSSTRRAAAARLLWYCDATRACVYRALCWYGGLPHNCCAVFASLRGPPACHEPLQGRIKLVLSPPIVAREYVRGLFFIDFIAAVPWFAQVSPGEPNEQTGSSATVVTVGGSAAIQSCAPSLLSPFKTDTALPHPVCQVIYMLSQMSVGQRPAMPVRPFTHLCPIRNDWQPSV